jgi:hypothetical protein
MLHRHIVVKPFYLASITHEQQTVLVQYYIFKTL